MVGSKPGPVAVRNDQTWTCGLSLKRLCIVLNRLEAIGFRDVRDGALTPLRLDPASRREDNNTLNMSPRAEPEEEKEPDEPSKTDHSTRDARKFSKGTAMEVAMASALTALDHPERVNAFWTVKEDNSHPNRFAPAYTSDLLVSWGAAAPTFQVVCEVSAGRTMTPLYLLGQLESALRHCRKVHKREPVDVTYGLLVNPGKIGSDERLQQTYREFLADEKNALDDPEGPIRLVGLRTGDFSSILRRLDVQDQLAFPKRLFARALDELHVLLREEKVPDGKQWMVEVFIDAVTAQPDLFDP